MNSLLQPDPLQAAATQRTLIQNQAFQAAVNGEPLVNSLNILARMVKLELEIGVRTAFYLAYPDGKRLHAIEGAGDMDPAYTAPLNGFPVSDDSFCSGYAMATGRPVHTRDVCQAPPWQPYLPMATAHQFRATSSYPILTRQGKAIGSLALYFPDVHEATAQEAALAKAITQAAAIILSQDTQTLEHTRAEEALRLAYQRKDEFLAMLAHELRNPMSTIRSGLQILTLTDGKDQTSRDTLAIMNRQTNLLVRMVDDLLDVSRISQGKIELKRQRVNLGKVIAQAAESVQPLYQEQGRRLQVELPTALIEVEGDKDRLTQVVANLLTNGARYTGEQGQVWLSLELGRQEAILKVRDNGIGLAADQLESIFELFVQMDNTLARSKGGLGLGLTLVKQLVELHGGRVAVQSEGLGQGSTFTVHLPTPPTAPEPEVTPKPQVNNPSAARRILVVDDNADAALTLAMLLKLNGYDAHTRTSGRAGIEAAEQLHPSAILLDIGMPELDGYATCGTIREQAWGQQVVIIALTGYGQADDRERTQEAGFDGHLVKPVDLGALTNLLTDLLEKRRKQLD
ncbi:hybrid sensor histidine kinase/response regulator [Spirosoma radiotolerans]|uniref:hybrid sensor histidine kinase/response regulator n=1 Tax=Spirosoma radiotolerans TaxID=1379870 RepID=UPI000697F4EE|nr:ATP-binding protein [Spirosoma radiotolerans]